MAIKNEERGSTMLETILYICLLIALGGAMARTVASVFNRYNTGRLAQQVIDLKRSILAYTAVNEDYSTLTLDGMIEKNALPLDMRKKLHAMGGKFNLGPATDNNLHGANSTHNKYMFYITFEGIDKEACVELLTQGQFFTDGSEMDSLQLNNNYCWHYEYSLFRFDNCGYSTSLKSQHFTIAEAMKGCLREEDNKITWIFS